MLMEVVSSMEEGDIVVDPMFLDFLPVGIVCRKCNGDLDIDWRSFMPQDIKISRYWGWVSKDGHAYSLSYKP